MIVLADDRSKSFHTLVFKKSEDEDIQAQSAKAADLTQFACQRACRATYCFLVALRNASQF
jgi:hypothetical protein